MQVLNSKNNVFIDLQDNIFFSIKLQNFKHSWQLFLSIDTQGCFNFKKIT